MNFSKLDAFMNDMPQRGYQGCELSVSKDGEIVYRRSVGYADTQKTRPSSPSDIYWIFSASKVITCIAAMKLVEQGVISLDDPVSKYIPEYADVMVKTRDGKLHMAENVMTVEHLFTMTGGMDYSLRNAATLPIITKGGTTLEVVRAMASNPLLFEPGTDYQYSLCHDVLAAVVEVASGMRFSEFLKKTLFEPLGVKDMGFFPNEEQKARFASMYTHNSGVPEAVEVPLRNEFILTDNYESGGAGLFATVDDYMKVITAVACGEILSQKTLKMMGENRLTPKMLNDLCNVRKRLYGYGWGLCGRTHMDPVMSLSRSPVGEFGWDGAANAFAMIDAKNRVALYFGTQLRGGHYGYNVIHHTIKNLAYEGLEI